MNKKDFYFDLPKELIAQTPLKERDASRLLVLDKDTGKIEHKQFRDIINYLERGDTLILNNSRVIPARLFGVREDTHSKVEILLLKRVKNKKDCWEALVKPGKKARIGHRIVFGEGLLIGEVVDIIEDGTRIIHFLYEGVFEQILDQLGTMPLPPYIKEQLEDQERYQTIYSKVEGSAAAPTAGLHFTEYIFKELKKKGVNIAFITLHVGLGTFRPVKEEKIEEHKMHSEYYEISQDIVDLIYKTKTSGKRVIAVGTTTVRTLETAVTKAGEIKSSSGWTDIFIYPGYQFKIIDGMITNFHLPESTLLMLVSAFAGRDKILNAYHEAVKNKYRFFSLGDAMLIK
ncbi:tRNA preQ1(34) S-adenosylmethionine ribosyltransferase-isomerase QueA [Garciella nitratireducens]|uniref:S-adenosylmethionine:tRNA ribosyltransferase-isomerase n=1 Tax=Garciella nitratireducens DSM 15102 TaxID=1121911 RepID=A0A1T4K1Q3_9FIRM|nr:tRNA preQ1(34) S-adenosylmethionine ribosyltransferase-isomerase QueA [Garciella nitratireducens]SJZ36299.1 S-adenosylmethionine--tRNA ribosyltransferase-isomerase [Garciella nitratireducens DSM 15102]